MRHVSHNGKPKIKLAGQRHKPFIMLNQHGDRRSPLTLTHNEPRKQYRLRKNLGGRGVACFPLQNNNKNTDNRNNPSQRLYPVCTTTNEEAGTSKKSTNHATEKTAKSQSKPPKKCSNKSRKKEKKLEAKRPRQTFYVCLPTRSTSQ